MAVLPATPAPRLALGGVTETVLDDRSTRTALITIDDLELIIVAVGQEVTGGVVIEEIGADWVVVCDRITRSRQTLVLGAPGS